MESGSEHDASDEARAAATVESEIYEHLQQLHDKGVINLDAPARAIVDALDKNYPAPTKAALEKRTAAARERGYWLVGDQGWCNHLT